VAYQAVVSTARVSLVKQRECAGCAGGVLERLVLWSGGIPLIVEVDDKPAVPLVDTARHQWLDHVPAKRVTGLVTKIRPGD
jgi:hypothetical protein